MARKFSQRSLDNLLNVHPDLIRVVAAALAASKAGAPANDRLNSSSLAHHGP